ncbi:DUF7657 domain-containing protein [Ottowia thiooxydans]|uniref:Glycosyltransferase RgtA/B/C/D-like domain-containing protein n=1 Tax=Ottowia thiooxydans TaxID=219182 RepID=A0ABV2Q2I1_9BURK
MTGFLKFFLCLLVSVSGLLPTAMAQGPAAQAAPEPTLFVDGVAVSPDGRQIRVKGWAVDPSAQKGPGGVAVSSGGIKADKMDWKAESRPDVAKHWKISNQQLGYEAMATWDTPLPSGPQQLVIQVEVNGKVAGAALNIEIAQRAVAAAPTGTPPSRTGQSPTSATAPATAITDPRTPNAAAPVSSATEGQATAPRSTVATPDAERASAQAGPAAQPKGARYAVFISLFLVVTLVFCFSFHRSVGLRNISELAFRYPAAPVATLLVLFAALVLAGVTGSSMGHLVGRANSPAEHLIFDRESSVKPLAFSPKSIRSDEWMVLTSNVLAQVNHWPPFPVVNQNLGPDGQNMLIIGMSGAPVSHWSTLAKPATWGYFFLPLKQALAFQWQLPIFGCLIALYCLLNLLTPLTRGRNLALAAMFCIAPYAAGWSFWPLYLVGLACGALALLIFIFKPTSGENDLASKLKLWISAVALGCLTAGFALTLYPPWQIPLAIFCSLFLIGYAVNQRGSLRIDKHSLGALALAVAITIALLWAWWIDARAAVEAIQATVYPGQRAALTGGGGFLDLLRGYANAETLAFKPPAGSNPSETASYFYVLVPLLALSIMRLRASDPQRWIWRAWTFFVVVALLYVITGFPLWLAEVTGLSRVPTSRLDIALGLACVLGIALLPGSQADRAPLAKPLVWITTALAGVLIAVAFWGAPKAASAASSASIDPVLAAVLLVAGLLMAYWLLIGRVGSAIAITLAIYAASVATFNPWSIAPDRVAIAEPLRKLLTEDNPLEKAPRVLVLTPGAMWSMELLAGGIPVVSGVHYYPQTSLWKGLGVSVQEEDVVNRYQHLLFVPVAPVNGAVTAIDSPQLDVVRVLVDPSRFSFATVGANKVMAPLAAGLALQTNPNLRLKGQHRAWLVYDVLPLAAPR